MGYLRLFLLRKLRLNRVLPAIGDLKWIWIVKILLFLFSCFLLVTYTYIIALFVVRNNPQLSGTLGRLWNTPKLYNNNNNNNNNETKHMLRNIDSFLLKYHNNASYYENQEGFQDWNMTESEEELPYNSTGCRVLSTSHTPDHQTALLSTNRCTERYYILVLIMSPVKNFYRRMLIRRTWGRERKHRRWKVFFVVELPLDQGVLQMLSCESEFFGDIIYGTYDYRYTMTSKVQMCMEWSTLYCHHHFHHLLLTQDTSYNHLHNTHNFLQQQRTVPHNKLYAGHVRYEAPVQRHGPYGLPKTEYRKKVYPRHSAMGGLVVSREVVGCMYEGLQGVPLLKVTGGYMGELALKCGVDVIHDARFKVFHEKHKHCGGYDGGLFVYHPVPSKKCMLFIHLKQMLKGT